MQESEDLAELSLVEIGSSQLELEGYPFRRQGINNFFQGLWWAHQLSQLSKTQPPDEAWGCVYDGGMEVHCFNLVPRQ